MKHRGVRKEKAHALCRVCWSAHCWWCEREYRGTPRDPTGLTREHVRRAGSGYRVVGAHGLCNNRRVHAEWVPYHDGPPTPEQAEAAREVRDLLRRLWESERR